MINVYFVYQFLKMLTTPFEEWDMYKQGIIDKKGNTLKKKHELNTAEEKNSFDMFSILVKNVKKAMEKVLPKSKLASYAAALYLIKEHNMFTNDLMEEHVDVDINKLVAFVEEEIANSTDILDKKPVIDRNRKKKEICDETDI